MISENSEPQVAVEPDRPPTVATGPAVFSAPESARQGVSDVPRTPAALQTGAVSENKPVLLKVTAQPQRAQPGDAIKAVENMIERWSKAWSGQNVLAYLSHYSPGFQPSGASDRPAWATQRISRLAGPKFIVLTLQDA
ncbi:hypothetical protein [Rhodoferax sp. PAMC 29310]|uniref:hypothetical protein n=1 Tax=Rhodoferax sp. PAMC 29310 TaxID=2822760 RepID=UPI001B32F930|nr:hypothetical protein [Rhodoferax sp. PAMC 29310]